MRVPFVDLRAQYEAHRDEIDAAIKAVIDETAFIGGRHVRAFEDSFAAALGVRNCIGVANGTDAIYIALRMLGVGPGDEVITTACTWIATAETISQCGARPVFVDIDEYFELDVAQVAAAVTERTKAIVPVHLYGQAAQVDVLRALCDEKGLHLVEDCAQAHFAERSGRFVGTHGHVSTFSFYPGKNLGAYGDAGAIVTNDDALARRCRMYANHGALIKHQHEIEGINSRLDGLQAAILSAKLPHLERWTRARQEIASHYATRLVALAPEVSAPSVRPGSTHVYHLFVVRVRDRDALRDRLSAKGIECAVHYPVPLPFMPAFAYLGQANDAFPQARRAQSEILSLPIYPEMTLQMVDHVVDTIAEFYGRSGN